MNANSSEVVGILMNEIDVGICSGSLIAPNLVLTARHCVSKIENETTTGGVSCSQTTFGPLFPPDGFRVTTGDVAFLATKYVGEVIGVPGDDAHLCGQDVALLVLLEAVPGDEASPLVPRVDSPIAKGEVYSAVGFGAIDDMATAAGTRRRLDGLHVSCVGEACATTSIRPAEWIGDHGVCSGDSGGPALDVAGRVVGVTSRGAQDCGAPVYGSAFGWGDWIKEGALHAAEVGGYAAPPWANGQPTDPEYNYPVGGACVSPDECASGRCLSDSDETYCTRACTEVATCPDGYICDLSHGGVCKRVHAKAGSPSGGGGSCAAAPGSRRSASLAPALLLLLGAILRRRRARCGLM